MSRQQKHVLPLLLAVAALVTAMACGKRPAGAAENATSPAAEAAPPLDPRLVALVELSFVPADAVAVVRVDLSGMVQRSPDPAETTKTFDFILRAQQPAAWQVLSSAGITIGRELGTLYLVAGAPRPGLAEPYLLGATGVFDADRLATGLKRTGAIVEEQPSGATIYRWKRSAGSIGAAEGPADLGEAAVGVAAKLILFGPPAIVRQALETRALPTPLAHDVRHGPLAAELAAIDRTATVWGVAAKVASLPGLELGHFQASLAGPGDAGDAALVMRARFATREQADAFGDKLRRVLTAATMFGDRTPLGASLARMRENTKLTVEETTLVASPGKTTAAPR